jgi:hypothetical protein
VKCQKQLIRKLVNWPDGDCVLRAPVLKFFILVSLECGILVAELRSDAGNLR